MQCILWSLLLFISSHRVSFNFSSFWIGTVLSTQVCLEATTRLFLPLRNLPNPIDSGVSLPEELSSGSEEGDEVEVPISYHICPPLNTPNKLLHCFRSCLKGVTKTR